MNDPQIATLMRTFVGEEDRHGKRPLYMAIVDELLRLGFGDATALKGIEGYGPHKQVHAVQTKDLAMNLPISIEVAETEEKVRSSIPPLREMIPEGLITLERIQMRLLSANAR